MLMEESMTELESKRRRVESKDGREFEFHPLCDNSLIVISRGKKDIHIFFTL